MTRFLIRKEPHFCFRFLTSSSHLPAILVRSSPRLRIRFFWARNAIYHFLGLVNVPKGSQVLIPAYLCKAAVEPIEAYGARPTFYAVDRDCAPDLADLEARMTSNTSVVMAVHHFGLPRRIHEVKQVCSRRGLILLEDCAHVLQVGEVGEPLGALGDGSVFSWRKFLPLYDGADLLLNGTAPTACYEISWQFESPLFTLKAAKNLLEEMLPQKPLDNQRVRAVAEASISSPQPSSHIVSSPRQIDRNHPSFVPEHVNFPMSRVSGLLFRHFCLEEIAAKRIENYGYLRAKLASVEGVRPLDAELPPTFVPWAFPVFIGDLPNVHASLRQLGIPAVSWGGVRHAAFSSAEFPAAEFLYQNLVFLPIHQDLDENALDLIIEAVKKVRQSARPTVAV